MKIFLDFDGTVVEHQYPLLGESNVGWIEVIDKLYKSGHEIIINTMRVEFENGTLEQAVEFINQSMRIHNNMSEFYFFENTDHKFDPTIWDWELHFKYGRIFIDDVCKGIPLKNGVSSTRQMVDWAKLNLEFMAHGLYHV